MKLTLILSALIVVASASPLTKFKGFQPESRIIGGQVAAPNQFPYNVLLIVTNEEAEEWRCAGTIISKDWILTAARCLENAYTVLVFAGSTELDPLDQTTYLFRFLTPEDITVHPDYNPKNFNNDIALLSLVYQPLLLNPETVWPIPLITPSEGKLDWEGKTVIATGWGKTEDGIVSSDLRYVDLKIENQFMCKELHPQGLVDNGVICAATATGTKGACEGDFGGALASLEGYLLGITSFAHEGCQSGYPIGFTRVSYYLDWIHEVTGLPIA